MISGLLGLGLGFGGGSEESIVGGAVGPLELHVYHKSSPSSFIHPHS